jgi:hypothetical protein
VFAGVVLVSFEAAELLWLGFQPLGRCPQLPERRLPGWR